MRKITWSIDAEYDYEENIEYLLREWSVKEVEEFIEKADEVINTLRTELVRYQAAKYRGIFKCVVCKQITLFYKEKDETEIELVRFWNNYQDDKKLKL
ncbi:MAG: hypothetical protein PF517_09505 [Salinivirgaceae bacterium]|jgi:plasmid stabilization system protein ParE|nr:hypothetical protein [Salinivirgaceae bacterium]